MRSGRGLHLHVHVRRVDSSVRVLSGAVLDSLRVVSCVHVHGKLVVLLVLLLALALVLLLVVNLLVLVVMGVSYHGLFTD